MAKSDYTQKAADEICERLADGESLNAICAGKGMPNKTTVFRWLREKPDFAAAYAIAREAQADSKFEDISTVTTGVLAGDIEPNAARVVIDAMKWQAGKLRPKKYGEKIDHTHTGADGGPIDANITVTFVRADG